MKKSSILLGVGMISLLLLSFNTRTESKNLDDHNGTFSSTTETYGLFEEVLAKDEAARNLSPKDIKVIELEEEIILDFNTAEYLPIGFNAYAKSELDLSTIVVEELEEEIVLDFDTAEYLPIGFNAYAGMNLDLNTIVVQELEEEIVLDFDTAEYLPKGFDPYTK